MLTLVFLSSFLLCAVSIQFLIKVGTRLEKRPAFARLSNGGVCRLGGLAIFVAFIFGFLLARLWWKETSLEFQGILAGGTLVLLLGLLDDVKELPPLIKLGGQVCAVAILMACGVRTHIYFIPDWLNLVVTAIWVLGITNAFNLLDILDGLAGGIVAIASLTFLLLGALTNNPLVSIYACCLAGATLGFLIYNMPPARIFMGDSGSMFAGFLLSGMAISISYAPGVGRELALIAPILILGAPVYDLVFLSIMRFLKGKSVIRKSPDHLALRIMKMGLSQKRTLLVMYSLSSLFCICAILITKLSNFWTAVILALTILPLFVIGRKAGRVKV